MPGLCILESSVFGWVPKIKDLTDAAAIISKILREHADGVAVRLSPAVTDLAFLVEYIPHCRQHYAKRNDYEQRQKKWIARIIEEP